MKIHTDNLTSADLHGALQVTGLSARGVYLDWDRPVSVHGSRSRHHRLDFYLIADDSHGRRYCNSGNHGAGYNRAATYYEWGAFLGELFHRDPTAIVGPYSDPADFCDKAAAWQPSNVPGPEHCPDTVDTWRNLYR